MMKYRDVDVPLRTCLNTLVDRLSTPPCRLREIVLLLGRARPLTVVMDITEAAVSPCT